MEPILRTPGRCPVCGAAELRTDEVLDGGLVWLAECRRCEHRFTAREPAREEAPGRAPARAAGAAGPEVAAAA